MAIDVIQLLQKRRRRTALRTAVAMFLGVAACFISIAALGHLFSEIEAKSQPQTTAKLEVSPIAPPTPPAPPPPPREPVQATESMPQMPALPPMELAVDAAPNALALPPFQIDANALRLPVVIPAVSAVQGVAAPVLQAPNMASPPRRLVTPDLKRYYPRRLIKLRIEGETKLELYIDATGSVERVEIISSVPPQRFESAALQAMRRVRYEPARDEKGNPIPGRVIETLEWRISK